MKAFLSRLLQVVLDNESHLILVTATVGVIGLLATLAVSTINFYNLRLSTTVSLMKQIQDLNLAIARGDKCLLAPLETGELSEFRDRENWISELYALFYQINIVHDSWVAHKSWLMKSNHTLMNTREIILMQAQRSPEQLKFILNGRRGYSYSFKRYILKRLLDLVYTQDLADDFCSDIVLTRPPRWIGLRRLFRL